MRIDKDKLSADALERETPSVCGIPDLITVLRQGLIPHHFSVRAASDNYFRTLSSVGVIVDFDPGGELFGIVDLLPNPRFKKAFETRLQGNEELSYATILNVFGLGDVIGAMIGALTGKTPTPPFNFSLDLDTHSLPPKLLQLVSELPQRYLSYSAVANRLQTET